jgi:acetyltransferase-like isoleucine patch superfamily enzyme
VVAAGAVVTKSFPGGNQILAGVPAIIVKKLSAYDDSSPENK